MTVKNINRIYRNIPKTLRLVVSLGSRCFDMNDVATPLLAQLWTTFSKITQSVARRWDAPLDLKKMEFLCSTKDGIK